MKAVLAMVAVGALASACATVPGASGGGAVPASISYETTPCFGFCPVYKLTVNDDGTGTFVGERNTGADGSHSFTVTPAQYAEFARRLASVRPASGDVRYDHETCELMATDMPTVRVGWQEADGAAQSLSFDYGCDIEKNRAVAEGLRAAPKALGIDKWLERPAGAPGVR